MGAVEVFVVLVAVALFVGVFIAPTILGIFRAATTDHAGWVVGIIAGWLVGLGWFVGLMFLFGPDRQRRREDAAARAQGYHPDYKRMGT
jgi:hypothetical protein